MKRPQKHNYCYFILAWFCVLLGFIGALLPLMPTTIFLIIAAWAFSKSSPKYHQWLRQHKQFGPLITIWEQHRAMPRKAKIIAISSILFSYMIIVMLSGFMSLTSFISGLCLLLVIIFILSIPTINPRTE